jgi:uncharacterized membrane protein
LKQSDSIPNRTVTVGGNAVNKNVRARPQAAPQRQSVLWLEFARQAHAFSAADVMPRVDVMVFSYQPLDLRAAQRYVVSTIDDFWARYSQLASDQRTYFELIRENHVCNLYFDLEFKWAAHPDVATPAAARRLVHALKSHAATILRTDLNYFVDLESSSDEKFSCHLVLRSPDVCFRSAVECGVWVRRLLLDVPELEFMIDPSVYTKNRLFRFAFSSKVGRNAPMLPVNRGGFASDEAIFKASLVTNVSAMSIPVLESVTIENDEDWRDNGGGIVVGCSCATNKIVFSID